MDSTVRRLDAPALSLLGLHEALPQRYPFLLQSGAYGVEHARFDILFAFPGEHLALDGARLSGSVQPEEHDFLHALDRWYRAESNGDCAATGLPFGGGWFLYLGFELAAQIEPSLRQQPAPAGLPTALAVRCRGALVRDRRDASLWAVAESDELAAQLVADGGRAPEWRACPFAATVCREDDPAAYREGVQAIRDYIRAGDVFQVNLAREWRASVPARVTPSQLYAALQQANPAPFAGLMRWGESAVISSSPERLLKIENGRAQTRPIAGTRPRRGEDAAMTRELLAHPKERAEHVMLIDLERNDLGRVCRYGSIRVDELMVPESYAHVLHIVSSLSGELRGE
ncbi:MAG: chorismate-binding protein, partial [Salinisphaera sp.]|nr:chorismate-binding protein [Salinisphaera sp.]